ncbi:GntR family transcriptional regulator [Desulfosarcina alkanivorans]|uniref:GntR family transcriptional regulator n=1 Tax=Desulfosarcina alkanivorans TaxID=571177 RepID=A0A5K7YE52_9BACT|nr:GntR family transcriptional regulator [Desulfosarcina alkanivorans]BBO67348.1 GntR family transcriptional regulator [Desulfosarcina alkanivorans]
MLAPTDKKAATPFELRSLREQVYRYLRAEMQSGRIVPDEYIRLNELSERLGISKTPLRDAIIQLECEGFVTILPRRGVLMNRLTLQDVADAYGIVGALEASVIAAVCDRFTDDRLDAMTAINNGMTALIEQDDFDGHYAEFLEANIAFHNLFLDLSDNRQIKKIVLPFKQRLYDFPRRRYIREWERHNCREHGQLVELIRAGDGQAAADLLQHRHWSFSYYEDYIRQFYRS